MTQLQPEVVLPDVIPEFPSAELRRELEERTLGRVPVREPDVLRRRAKYLLRKLGGKFKGLEGSQTYGLCDHVEIVTHEYAHCLHYGLPGPTPLKVDLDCAICCRSKEENNENELRTSASTMLVLEYLGLPYDPYSLVWSTYRNMRGVYFKLGEVWRMVVELRQDTKVIEVARQIACVMAKMKYVET